MPARSREKFEIQVSPEILSAVKAIAQSLDRRLDDMGRRFEIGLADAEIDDVAPLRRERGRAGEHRECVLFADAVERRDGVQHVPLSPAFLP